jgi:hypothetical protein
LTCLVSTIAMHGVVTFLGATSQKPRFISPMLCFHRPTCLDPILMIFGPDKRSSRRPPILYTWHTCFQSWYSVFAGRLARHSMARSKRRVIFSSYSLVDPSQHRWMVLQGDVVTPLIDCLGVSWRVWQLLFFSYLIFWIYIIRGCPHCFVLVWPCSFIYKVARKPCSRKELGA